VTTVFARQGSYAHDPARSNAFLPADLTIEDIADLLEADLPRSRLPSLILASGRESMR
jgi:hypothetical protein